MITIGITIAIGFLLLVLHGCGSEGMGWGFICKNEVLLLKMLMIIPPSPNFTIVTIKLLYGLHF